MRTQTPQDRVPVLPGVAWLVVIMVAQVLLCVWCAHLSICANPGSAAGHFSTRPGDHFSYLGAMEHFVQEGRYYFTNWGGDAVLAGRMPFYGVPYFVLRQFMGAGPASDGVVVLQTLLSSVAIWLLARTLASAVRSPWPARLFILAAVGSVHLIPYLVALQPDGAGASLLAIALWAYWRTEIRERRADRWVLGIVLALLISIKPYYVLLFPLISARWWYKDRLLGRAFTRSLTLALPLVAVLLPWWIRNLALFDHFFPFQQDMYAGYGFDPVDLRVRSLLVGIGEDGSTWWEPSNMACAMRFKPAIPCTFKWPEDYSPDLVRHFDTLRTSYLDYQAAPSTAKADGVIALIDTAQQAYAREHPWSAHGLSRLVLVRKFLQNSGSFHLPVHPSNPCYRSWQMIPKLAASAGYACSLLGFGSALLLAVRRRLGRYWVWLVPTSYLLVLFPLLLGAVEWRYFEAAYLIDLWLFCLIVGRFLMARSSSEERGDRPDHSVDVRIGHIEEQR